MPESTAPTAQETLNRWEDLDDGAKRATFAELPRDPQRRRSRRKRGEDWISSAEEAESSAASLRSGSGGPAARY